MKTENSYGGLVWKKRDWRIGESITEEKMDNIENGVAIVASQVQDIIDGGGGSGGSGTSSVIEWIKYAVGTSGINPPPDSQWDTDLPEVQPGKWLWTKVHYSSGENVVTVSYVGKDGDSTENLVIEYGTSDSGDTPPEEEDWTTEYSTPEKGTWFWVRTTYPSGTQSLTCSYIGEDGKDGRTVNIVEVARDEAQGKIYVRLNDNRIVEIMLNSENAMVKDGNLHFAWATNISINKNTTPPSLGTENFSTTYSVNLQPKYIGIYSSTETQDSLNPIDYSWAFINSNGVKDVNEYYGISADSNTPPSTYSTTMMQPTSQNPYLWNYEEMVYAFGAPLTTTPHIISIYSETRSIREKQEYYLTTSTSEMPEDISEFSTEVQIPSTTNPYLWNYEVLYYTDDTSEPTGIRLIGVHGKNGAPAQTYHLLCTPSVVKREDDGSYSNGSVVLSGKYTQGTTTQQNYSGWFRLIGYRSDEDYYSEDSTAAGTSWTFNVSNSNWQNVKYFVGILSKSSNFNNSSNVLDTQTIPVIENSMGYTVMLDNEAHVFPGNTVSANSSTVEVSVLAYKGTSHRPANIGTISAPQGMSITLTDNGTVNAKLTIAVNSRLTQAGVLTIPVTVDSTSFNLKFSYSIAFTGANGSTPTNMVQMYAKNQDSEHPPTGSNVWSYAIPSSIQDGDVIWVKTVLSWGDGSSPTETAPSVDWALMAMLDQIKDLDESLNREGIFNRLTNNGQNQGIFVYENGDYYVNGTYIRALEIDASQITSGEITADRIKTSELIIGPNNLTSELKNTINTAAQVTETVADIQDSISDIEDEIESIKSQSDGSITYWFKEVDPTLRNEPAVNWNTTALKEEHIGDLYYNTTNNNCWRWLNTNNTYGWNPVQDAGVQEALRKAQEAKDVADGKRRIFFNTPQVPYDVGDVWINDNNGTGEILRCTNSKNSTQSFASSDWTSAAEYSDNTLAATANKKVQTIYRSRNINSPYDPYTTTWVTDSSGNQNTYTIKRPKYNSSYPYLFIATQTMNLNNTIDCTNFILDDGITIIDGGWIKTGKINANRIDVNNINITDLNGVINFAQKTDLPTDISDLTDNTNYITTITNNIIKTTSVVAQNLTVKSANIDGTISANKITSGTLIVGGSGTNYATINVKDSSNNLVANLNRDGLTLYGENNTIRIDPTGYSGAGSLYGNITYSLSTSSLASEYKESNSLKYSCNLFPLGLNILRKDDTNKKMHKTRIELDGINIGYYTSTNGSSWTPEKQISINLDSAHFPGFLTVDEHLTVKSYTTINGNLTVGGSITVTGSIVANAGIQGNASNVTGIVALAHGGTGGSLTQNPSMLVSLDSTSSDTVFQANPRPGVRGILPIEYGGTGASSAPAARTKLGLRYSSSGAWFNAIPYIDSNGVMEIGKIIDFHETNTDTSDYTARLAAASGVLYCSCRLSATTGIDIVNQNSPWPRITFGDKNNPERGQIFYDCPIRFENQGSLSNSKFMFREHSMDASGNKLNYYENYYLPDCSPNRTSNGEYRILTTKTVASGTVAIDSMSTTKATVQITFNTPLPSVPSAVLLQLRSDNPTKMQAISLGTSSKNQNGFTLNYIATQNITTTTHIDWLAIS